MKHKALTVAALISLLSSSSLYAQEFKLGDITIANPWSRATPKGSPVGAGYLIIKNSGKTGDRLISASSDGAREVQVHEMSMDGGVMKMRELRNGLELPAGAAVELKPGGYHLMLMDLKNPLMKDSTVKVTLKFEHAGTVPVEFKIGGMGDNGPAASTGTMDSGMKGMDHGSMKMGN